MSAQQTSRASRSSEETKVPGHAPRAAALFSPTAPSDRMRMKPAVEFELFSSSFCSACRQTHALLEQAVRHVPAARIRQHNIAEQPELATQHQIKSTPTVIVRDAAGDQVMRAEGAPTIHHRLVAADSALSNANAPKGP